MNSFKVLKIMMKVIIMLMEEVLILSRAKSLTTTKTTCR